MHMVIQKRITPPMRTNKVDEVKLNKFPYLDMEFFWNDEGCLKTRIYQKPNQQLK